MDFVNRRQEIERLESFLQTGSPQWILAFHGIPGIGASELLRQLLKRPGAGWVPAWIDFSLRSSRDNPRAVLQALTRPLRQSNLPAEAWDAYERRVAEIEERKRLIVEQAIHADNSATIIKPSQKLVINLGEETARSYHDAQRKQTRAWLDLVQHLDGNLIVFIDGWHALRERASEQARAWVAEDLLLQAHERLPHLRVVVAGHRPLDSDRIVTEAIPRETITSVALGPLTRDDAAKLMRQLDVDDVRFQQAVLDRVGGHPGLISLAAALWRQRPGVDLIHLVRDLDSEAASEWFIGALVGHIGDQRSRSVLQKGVILRQWTLETLDAVCECEGLDLRWLLEFASYPFVRDSLEHPGFKEFIELVREVQGRQIWQQQPELFRRLHESALQWYTDTEGMMWR